MRQDTPITKTFRDYIYITFPLLEKKWTYRKFLHYLCFSNFFSKEKDFNEKELLIPKEHLYPIIVGGSYDPNWNFEEFLFDFQRDILPELQWDNHYYLGHSRRITDFGLPDEFERLLLQETLKNTDIEKVYFISGAKWNNVQRTKNNQMEREEYKEQIKPLILNATQQKIMNYMQSVNGGHSLLQKYYQNQNELLCAINQLEKRSRLINFRKVIDFVQQPQGFYLPSETGNTVRLHCHNANLVNLPSHLRKIACKGWSDIDLKNSQFAIIAQKLQAPVSLAFIDSDLNLWQELYSWAYDTKDKPNKEQKDTLKEVFYSIPYGRAEKMTPQIAGFNSLPQNRKNQIVPFDQICAEYNCSKLQTHPIVMELFSLRKDWYAQIKKDKGATDIYGSFLSTQDRGAYAIAASLMQAIEMEIIAPVFDIANQRPEDIKIMLWQHDGATISFLKKTRKEREFELLKEAVENKAQELNIKTKLEITHL